MIVKRYCNNIVSKKVATINTTINCYLGVN